MARRNAFTLIELSIAVFVLAMLVAVCIPAFVRSYNDVTLRETARAFSTTCLYARIQAVQYQTNATLHVDLDRQMFWLTQTSNPEQGGDATLKTYELSKRTTFASIERTDDPGKAERVVALNFYPNGTCDAATAIFRGTGRGLMATLDPITCRADVTTIK